MCLRSGPLTEGTNPDLEKIAAVVSWLVRKNVKEVRSFLGLPGFYHRFISRYAQLAAPLIELLKKNEQSGQTTGASRMTDAGHSNAGTAILPQSIAGVQFHDSLQARKREHFGRRLVPPSNHRRDSDVVIPKLGTNSIVRSG